MDIRWDKEINDNYNWEHVGKNVERRPKPAPGELSQNPTDHMRINRKLTGKHTRLSQDYGQTFSDWEPRPPVAIAGGPYGGYLLSYESAAEVLTTEDAAINKALAKMRGVQFDLGVFLGELPETLRFLHGGTSAILTDYQSASRRAEKVDRQRSKLRKLPLTRSNLKRINNLTNLISSIWLTYRYGVMPLYYALHDLYTTFEEGLGKSQRKTIKTSAKQKVEGLYHSDGAIQEGSVKIRVTLTADCEASPFASLGMDNPALVAWELTPLSFVFDWFIDVGDFLLAFQPEGTTFVSGSVSTKVETRVYKEPSKEVSGHLVIEETSYKGTSQSYQRRILYGMPSPRLYYNPSMNWKRYVDAFALTKHIFLKADKYSVKK